MHVWLVVQGVGALDLVSLGADKSVQTVVLSIPHGPLVGAQLGEVVENISLGHLFWEKINNLKKREEYYRMVEGP